MRNFVLLFTFLALVSVSRAYWSCTGENDYDDSEAVYDDDPLGTDFPITDISKKATISWPDGSGQCSDDGSEYYSWGGATSGFAPTVLYHGHAPKDTKHAGLIASIARTGNVLPTSIAFGPSEIPFSSTESEPLGVPNTQSFTSTNSTNGALASLMHYRSNDQLVGFFCLFVAGLAGAGAILL